MTTKPGTKINREMRTEVEKGNAERLQLFLPLTFVFIMVFFLFPAHYLSAQKASSLASEYIRKYKDHTNDASLLAKLNQYSPEDVIEAFQPFSSDSLTLVRSVALQRICEAGLRSQKPETRQEAIEVIITSLDDKDAGNIGSAISLLTSFRPDDFTAEHKYIISQKVKPGTIYLDRIILLTGYLNIRDLIYNFHQTLNDKTIPKRTRLNMHLAMARMDDTVSVAFLKTRLEKVKIDNDIVYDVFPLLTYTRQKVFFDLLLEVIMSYDENCLSSNPDKLQPVICAFRVMEMVAPYIHNFPVQVDKSGGLISDNYDQTLQQVRQWIVLNKQVYTLKYDTY